MMPRPQFRMRSLFLWVAAFAFGIAAGQKVVPAVRARFLPEPRVGLTMVEGWRPPPNPASPPTK
jgi:hypothetical protein